MVEAEEEHMELVAVLVAVEFLRLFLRQELELTEAELVAAVLVNTEPFEE